MDNTGAVVNQISYDSFGNVTAQTNAGTNFRFGYTGREYDSETGLYYYRSRYLEPQTGLFISQDGIGFSGGNTNLYGYVGNSPTNYTDPSGNIPAPIVLGVGGFLFDSAVQIVVNRGFDNYDWKQAVQTGLSTAIGGPVAGKILGPGASLGSRIVVNAVVSGITDGGLQLTRNKLEGKCDVWEDVGQQTITGAAGGAGGELLGAGAKAASPHVKNLMNAASDALGGLSKGAKGMYKNFTEAVESAFKNSADNVATTSDEIFEGTIEQAGTGGGLRYVEQSPSDLMFNQELQMSCGAACGRQLLSQMGIDVTESTIRNLGEVKYDVDLGIQPGNLARGLSELSPDIEFQGGGLPYEVLEIYNNLETPWIAVVSPSTGNHYVIVDGIEGDFVKIRDPWGELGPGTGSGLEGKLKLSYFEQVWKDGQYRGVIPRGKI